MAEYAQTERAFSQEDAPCPEVEPFGGVRPVANFGFPVEAAFAQLEGYARNLARQTDDPHSKMQLERVRTAALDLASTITNEMVNGNPASATKMRVRRTSQPALIDVAQLKGLLDMAGRPQQDRVLAQLAIDLSAAQAVLDDAQPTPQCLEAARRVVSLAQAIGADRAARLAQDLLDGITSRDRRKCTIVADMLRTDLTQLIALLGEMAPTANLRPAE